MNQQGFREAEVLPNIQSVYPPDHQTNAWPACLECGFNRSPVPEKRGLLGECHSVLLPYGVPLSWEMTILVQPSSTSLKM
jgi:hypothetical protein